jgi:hypothetical protein
VISSSQRMLLHNERRISMPSPGFESATPAVKRIQTYALDLTATGIGQRNTSYKNCGSKSRITFPNTSISLQIKNVWTTEQILNNRFLFAGKLERSLQFLQKPRCLKPDPYSVVRCLSKKVRIEITCIREPLTR